VAGTPVADDSASGVAVPLLARLGYVRFAGLLDSWADGLPIRQAAEATAFLSMYRHLKTTRDESLAGRPSVPRFAARGGWEMLLWQ